MKVYSVVSIVLIFFFAIIPFEIACAQAAEEEKDMGLFSDWGGVKSSLAQKGIDLNVVYKIESVSLLAGDPPKKSTSLGNIDITADFDLEKLGGYEGWNIFLYGLGNHGGSPTDIVGDSFGTSNIQAPSTFKLYEAYFKKSVSAQFSGLFGLRDLNADYYVTESSKTLLNSAFGISPALSQTGPNGPSIFPVTAPTLSFQYKTTNEYYIQAAIFNAVAGNPNHPDGTHVHNTLDQGTLSILEAGFLPQENVSSTKCALGVWSYSEKIEQFDTSLRKKANNGVYFLFEQGLSEQVNAFLRAGTAEKSMNTFSVATELGAGFTGLFAARPDDILTIGVAYGEASSKYRSFYGIETKNETVYEVAYTMPVYRGVYLTPDFQYIVNPGLDKDSKAAQVGSLRAEIHF